MGLDDYLRHRDVLRDHITCHGDSGDRAGNDEPVVHDNSLHVKP